MNCCSAVLYVECVFVASELCKSLDASSVRCSIGGVGQGWVAVLLLARGVEIWPTVNEILNLLCTLTWWECVWHGLVYCVAR